jgi:hypothetical protein
MASIWKWLSALFALAVFAVCALALIVWFASAEARQEHAARESALKPLLRAHATREQVARTLGVEFKDYSVGSTNRWVIDKLVSIPKVRQSAERYPGLLFHTTANTMTWLFFDSEGRLHEYYICGQ